MSVWSGRIMGTSEGAVLTNPKKVLIESMGRFGISVSIEYCKKRVLGRVGGAEKDDYYS